MAARLGTHSFDLPCRHTRGQAFLEFALIILLFVTLALLVFEGGLLSANWFALGNAAREGARASSRSSATDAEVLDAVNRAASLFSGSFASVTAEMAPQDCTADHAVCVCRHPPGTTACSPTAERGDLVDVTLRHRFTFVPAAGGFIGQNAGIQLVATERARVE